MNAAAGGRYVPQLDGLRALAVLMVFAYHAFRVPLMWAGVDLFFILSGYLITGILVRERERMPFAQMLRGFYLRRAERIVPAYVLFLGLTWVTLRFDWSHTWGYYAFFLQNVPYALGKEPAFALVPLWSLAVEQHFYLLWPALVFFLPRRWLPGVMVALLVGEPVLRAVCTPLFAAPEPIYCLTPFRLDALAAGALAALVLPRCEPKRTARAAGWTAVCGAVVLVGLSAFPWFRRSDNTALVNGLLYSLNIVALGGLFIWCVAARGGVAIRLLSSAPARALGRISYMFYLLHLLVLTLTASYVIRHSSRLAGAGSIAAIAFVVTCAMATVSWFVVERPVLSLSAGRRSDLQG